MLCVLLVVGCTLDIPEPSEPAPATKSEYDVPADGSGPIVRHYDGNDQLLWIDRYDLDPSGLQLKKYHYSALDVLLWYEYRRFEQFAGSWLMTRTKHYVGEKDNGTLAWSRSWAYDAQGRRVVQVDFDDQSRLTGVSHTWGETPSQGYRPLQVTQLSGAGVPTEYERTLYVSAAENRVSKKAKLDGDRNVTWAQSLGYVGDNRTSVAEYDTSTWSRTTTSFLPDTSTRYRSVWYKAAVTTKPSAPGFADQSGAPVIATSSASTAATFDPDPANALDPKTVLSGFAAVQLVDFPTLDVPSSWTPQAWEYYLPGPYGEVTLRFDANGLPKSLTKAASGDFQAIDMEFTWDALGRLTQRIAKYAGNPVLTVDLHRDAQGRIDRVDTSGSMMKVPLSYILRYANANTVRPSSMSVSAQTVDLLTLTLTYDDANTGAGRFGIGALSFDDHIQTIRVGIGGPADLLDAVGLEFLAPVTTNGVTTKEVEVFDVLNKQPSSQVLKGRLVWTIDTNENQTSFQWQTWNGSSYRDRWSYDLSWGAWAQLATGAVDIVDDSSNETVASMETKLAGAMRLADSFDFERLFQLVDQVRAQLPAQQAQFERTASSLLDQIKEATGR